MEVRSSLSSVSELRHSEVEQMTSAGALASGLRIPIRKAGRLGMFLVISSRIGMLASLHNRLAWKRCNCFQLDRT